MSKLCTDRSREVLQNFFDHNSISRSLGEGREIEILKLLEIMERIRQSWDAEKSRGFRMHEQCLMLEKEAEDLRSEVRIQKEQLRDARAQIASLMSDKQSMEQDIIELERKVNLVNDLLKNDHKVLSDEDRQKIATLKCTTSYRHTGATHRKCSDRRRTGRNMSNGDEIDFDKTGDSIAVSYDDSEESYLRNGKVYRRSHNLVNQAEQQKAHPVVNAKRSKDAPLGGIVEEETATPCKRLKDGADTMITATTTIRVDPEGRTPTTAKVAIRRSMNRSMSESNIINAEDTTAKNPTQSNLMTPRHGISVLDLRSPLNSLKTWTKGGSIETRPHTYSNYTSIIGDRCTVCNRWIGIGGKPALKCNDCCIRLHKACTGGAPMPCLPRTPTPRTPGKQRLRLKEFCPTTRPMIPPLIIHCVLAIEKDHLNCEGIYRIPGQESQIVKLIDEYKNNRSVPKLDNHDTETITGCIKRFLREIRDPVIPTTSWDEFVRASETNDFEALNLSIVDLPIPNRDTLAFLCAHFQRVCENSIRNKMTPDVLARSVAPTIVGRAPTRNMNMAQSADEVAKQIMVMTSLLKMPRDYWQKLYATEQENHQYMESGNVRSEASNCHTPRGFATPRTNYMTPSKITCDPNQSILGPLDTPPSGHTKLLQSSATRRRNFFGDPF